MTLSSPTTEPLGLDSLLDDPKSVIRLRILRSARHVLAERGLSVSMEEIADAAGMGRRTLFRYFESREELIAGALSSALDWYDGQVVGALRAELPLEEWLLDLVTRLHSIHQTAGRGLWQLAAAKDDELPPQLAGINGRRRRARRATTEAIADAAWKLAAGKGAPPSVVTDAFALAISSFATHSMIDDYGSDADSVARCTTAMLSALLRSEAATRSQPVRAPVTTTRASRRNTPAK